MHRVLAKWAILLAAGAATAGVALGTWNGLWRAGHVWKGALDHRRESLSTAQDRLFGVSYMAAIRSIRARAAETATLHVIDDQSHEGGACYFALNLLAPRRLVLLGATRSDGVGRLARRLPPGSQWVLFVPDNGKAPELVPAAAIRRPRERARQARP